MYVYSHMASVCTRRFLRAPPGLQIRASIQSARQKFDPSVPLWVIFQPHTFSRLEAMVDGMARSLSGADRVIVSGVYGARETPTSAVAAMQGQDEQQQQQGNVDVDGAYLAASIKGGLYLVLSGVDCVRCTEILLCFSLPARQTALRRTSTLSTPLWSAWCLSCRPSSVMRKPAYKQRRPSRCKRRKLRGGGGD